MLVHYAITTHNICRRNIYISYMEIYVDKKLAEKIINYADNTTIYERIPCSYDKIIVSDNDSRCRFIIPNKDIPKQPDDLVCLAC